MLNLNILFFNTILQGIDIILKKSDGNIYREHIETKKQSELLVSSIKSILDKHNLNYNDIDIYSSIIGPGNFTSIKTNLAVLKMLQLATHKKIIVNNLFEVLSFGIQCDIVLLYLGTNKYYIRNGNSYSIINKADLDSFLEENKNATILTNDTINGNFLYSELSNDNILKLIESKIERLDYTKNIQPLYIEEAKITERKN